VKTSRRWPGSGLGFGLGAFFASFLPLSLLPMAVSMTQNSRLRKAPNSPGTKFLNGLWLRFSQGVELRAQDGHDSESR
jgi:hypothetical protein